MFLDRRAEEFLCESGDEDERVADVGVSGEQRPLSLHCESRSHLCMSVNRSLSEFVVFSSLVDVQ